MIEKTEDGQAIVIEFRRRGSCFHNHLLVDEDLEKVSCKNCGETLNPFFAIKQMMRLSGKWRSQKAAADLAREEAEKKTRTKCEHCLKLTKIKTNVSDLRIAERAEEERKNGN